MEFGWSEEQQALYQRIYTGAQALRSEAARRLDPALFVQRWREAAQLGMASLPVPKEYGGGGHGALTTAHGVEAFARGSEDMGLSFAMSAHQFACCMPIVEAATESAKQRYLPKLCDGSWIGANAITESEAGSDVFALKLSVTPDGDHYVLNGVKSWVTNGPVCDVFVVYGTTDSKAGYFGITGFIVDAHSPGVTLGPPIGKSVMENVPAGIITLENVRVPAENRLGEEGAGASIFTHSMYWERCVLFAGYLGLLDRQLERTIQFAKKRKQFGKSIGKNQAVSHAIADMKIRLEGARLLLYRSAWLMDQGKRSAAEIAISKLAVSEASIASSLAAIQVHGSLGTLHEVGIEKMLRDSVPSTLFSGTSEIQRDLIARELGL